jgi:hypothetical protein
MPILPLPKISITDPNGNQLAVPVECLPAREDELVPGWELFPSEEPVPAVVPPANSPTVSPSMSILSLIYPPILPSPYTNTLLCTSDLFFLL